MIWEKVRLKVGPMTEPVEIPWTALSREALQGVIDDFLLREGTDYGAVEVEYSKKVERIRKQLESGDIRILFDPESGSVTLMTEKDWSRAQARGFPNKQNEVD